jgi:hypothetical protein
MSRPKEGYPTPIGSVLLSVFPVTGPASYSQYTAPSTGGQDVQLLPNAGIKTGDVVLGGISTDGVHRAEVVQLEASTVNGQTLANSRIVVKWYVVATGSEVAGGFDLSDTTVYLTAIGPK